MRGIGSLATLGVVALGWLHDARAAEAQGKPKATVEKKSASAPQLSYESFRKKVEVKVAEKREEQIVGIKRLLDLGPAEDEIPDLEFRLAELYFEKGRYHFFLSQEANDKAAASKTKDAAASLDAEQKKQAAESKKWAKQAVGIYKDVRDKYPKYPRMPEVLFALGQSYWSEGKLEAAMEVYADLIKRFRDNPLVAEAWLAFGEYYFGENDVQKALKSYEKAAVDKRSRAYGFALYKQGWCYLNLSDWNQALRKFQATVVYSQLAEELSGENRIQLGREAQKDYVRAYAHVGDPARAKFQLAELLGVDACATKECFGLLEQLAGLWYDQGAFDESMSIYRQLIELNPTNSRNPFFQGRIVDLVSRSRDRARTIAESRRLIDVLNATKKIVAEARGTPEEIEKARTDVREAEEFAEMTIRKLAQTWNQEAKKLRQKEGYGSAKTMYTDYLALFSDSKFVYEMRFQLADLHYKLEEFDAASKGYEATVVADPKGKYLVEAANDNVLALEEHLKDLDIAPPKSGEAAQPIHPEKVRLLEACERYVRFVPADQAKELIAVKFKSAKIYYDYAHYDEALKRFDDIAMSHPESKQGEYAANLVIDVYNLRKDWKVLYDTARRYLGNAALVKDRPSLAKELSDATEYAKFALVQALEEQVQKQVRGDMRRVAEAYEEFYAEFPKSKNADKALFNASVAWDRVGRREHADELRATLVREFKNSELGADVAYHIAKSKEERTHYEAAAEAFSAFAEKYETDKRASDALYNASVFYAGVGKVEKASTLRVKYLEKYGKKEGAQKEAASIYYSIARDMDRVGRFRDAAQRYAEFAKKFPDAPEYWDALWREAELRREKLGHRTEAEKIEKQILGSYRYYAKKQRAMPPQAARYASQVSFRLVDQEFEKYKQLRVRTPSITNPKPFQQSLEEKAIARERMIEAYKRVVTDYQQAESTVASLYRIAVAWDEFVRTLMAVPCPAGVGDDICALVKEGIEEKAAPAREAAFAHYKACVDKSNELNTFTEQSTRCVKALETLAPDSFPRMVEKTMEWDGRSTGVSIVSNDLMLDVAASDAPSKDATAKASGSGAK